MTSEAASRRLPLSSPTAPLPPASAPPASAPPASAPPAPAPPVPTPPAPPPPPVRTRFAVGLQLGRMFPTLLALVRQQYCGDPAAAQSALQIATAILDGARDRSRDRHLRSLL